MKKDKRTPLEKEIDAVTTVLNDFEDPTSDEYAKVLNRLEQLADVQEKMNSGKPVRKPIDPNTILIIAANLVGMGFTMGYEQLHVIATKAWNLIIRPKI